MWMIPEDLSRGLVRTIECWLV